MKDQGVVLPFCEGDLSPVTGRKASSQNARKTLVSKAFPSYSRSNSHAAIDWGKMAEQWLQEKEAERRKQKQRLTPRPSPSPMIESTPMSIAGDATPLLDEMDR